MMTVVMPTAVGALERREEVALAVIRLAARLLSSSRVSSSSLAGRGRVEGEGEGEGEGGGGRGEGGRGRKGGGGGGEGRGGAANVMMSLGNLNNELYNEFLFDVARWLLSLLGRINQLTSTRLC